VSSSVAICAGEASGDLNGAGLVSELRRIRPEIEIWGAGGPRMRDAGVDVLVDTTGGGAIGISETLRSLPGVAMRYAAMRSLLLSRKPDLFVPIDYGAFNTRLAQIARKNGIPVVYYFPPSSWRRRPRNSPTLLACGGKAITPFPWSAELLREKGIDARFVGHPLVDLVAPTTERDVFFSQLGLSPNTPTIGLLPGSRGHEIKEHMPEMLGCAEIMSRELGRAQFLIAAAGRAEGLAGWVSRFSEGRKGFPEVRVVAGQTYDCISHSDFVICKSGTATLEAAILGTPMIIVYRGTPIMRFEFRFRGSVLEEFIGLPNIVANRGICPELINYDVTAAKLADVALDIIRDPHKLAGMRASLGEVKERLGGCGALLRAARTLVEMGGL